MTRLDRIGTTPCRVATALLHVSLLALGFAASLAAAGDAAAAPTARFTATPVQQPVCAAPCAVHLDARNSDDPQYTRDFHVLDYEFSCGIAAAGRTPGTWQDGASRDVAHGPITGCVYADPGTYTVQLTVRAPDGETGTMSTSVVVADPNAEYGDAGETWCFADSGTPGGAEFAACPNRNTAQHVVTTSFASALTTCGARTGHRRCLFRAGDTFDLSSGSTLSDAGGIVGRYDAGAAPLVTGPADQALGLGENWTVTGLRFLPTDAQGSSCGTQSDYFNLGTAKDGITLHELVLDNLSYHGVSTASGSGTGVTHTDRIALVGSTLTTTTTGSACGGQLFLRSERSLVIGNVLDGSLTPGTSTYNFRTVHFPYGAIQHNRIRRPGSNANNLSLRAWAGTATNPPNAPTQYTVIADNHFSAQNPGMGFMRTCQSNTCDSAAPNYTDVQHLLVERNFFTLEPGALPTGQFLIGHFMGGDLTIRNNVVDAQGIDFSQAGSRTRLVTHAPGLGTGRNEDRVHVLNNTLYSDDAGPRTVVLCDSMSVGTGHECLGNLAYVPANSGTDVIADGAGWSANRANQFANATPFASTVPQQGATTPASFEPAATGPAKDSGDDFVASTSVANVRDFAKRCRPIARDLDAGAREQGAAACSGSPPPPAPVCGDGRLDTGEACDDGNLAAGDGCSATCSVEVAACGNGRLESGELCDDGNLLAGDGCNTTCRTEVCGNGVRDAAELCDDGNLAAGDGCNAICRTEICGNRVIDARETCDDGNLAAGDGCSATCSVEVAACGNGRLESGELCDDGNVLAGDGCRANCTVEACGDGLRDPDEACDDGNAIGGDGCRATCTVEACGDGVLDGGEGCDDGNVAAGDGCSAICVVEAPPVDPDEYRANVGGTAFVDSIGRPWTIDTGFVNGGTPISTSVDIRLTTDDALYRNARTGPAGTSPLTLSFPVSGTGPYRVRLHFAEIDTTVNRAGKRVFDVVIEDAFRVSGVDVYAAVGYARPYARDFWVNVDDGVLDVRFEPRVGRPFVSGVEVSTSAAPTDPPKFVDGCTGKRCK
jgi:cysteine-rich repeat protein